jgi:hypothetical protein
VLWLIGLANDLSYRDSIGVLGPFFDPDRRMLTVLGHAMQVCLHGGTDRSASYTAFDQKPIQGHLRYGLKRRHPFVPRCRFK